jgi:hypothetical protein
MLKNKASVAGGVKKGGLSHEERIVAIVASD